MTPSPFAEKIWAMKQHFDRFEDQKKTRTDSVISLNEAHITLKSRFYLKDQSLNDDLINAVKKINLQPIKVNVKSCELFESETLGNVLVGIVENPLALTLLHEQIVESITPFTTPETLAELHPYKPHISFIYNIPSEKISAIRAYIKQNILPFSYEMRDFYLLRNIEGINKERVILSIIQA